MDARIDSAMYLALTRATEAFLVAPQRNASIGDWVEIAAQELRRAGIDPGKLSVGLACDFWRRLAAEEQMKVDVMSVQLSALMDHHNALGNPSEGCTHE